MIWKEAIFDNSRKYTYLGDGLERLKKSTKILSEYVVFWPCLNHASPEYKVRDSPRLQFDLNQGFYLTIGNEIK